MTLHPYGLDQGERRKADALAILTERRETVVRRAQRALLTVLLNAGSATADDVRELVELPPGINAKCFGAAPGATCSDWHHSRCRLREDMPAGRRTLGPLLSGRWPIVAKAQRWLDVHADLPDPPEDEPPADGSQGLLFPIHPDNTPTPTATTAGAGN